jgi:hypothetical protein
MDLPAWRSGMVAIADARSQALIALQTRLAARTARLLNPAVRIIVRGAVAARSEGHQRAGPGQRTVRDVPGRKVSRG